MEGANTLAEIGPEELAVESLSILPPRAFLPEKGVAPEPPICDGLGHDVQRRTKRPPSAVRTRALRGAVDLGVTGFLLLETAFPSTENR